jgi:hypothetical protein
VEYDLHLWEFEVVHFGNLIETVGGILGDQAISFHAS